MSWEGMALLFVAGCVVALAARRVRSSRSRVSVPDSCNVREELLPLEKKLAPLLPGVTTVTFLHAEAGADAAGVDSWLRARVASVVAANPWLTSFIGKQSGELSLCYATGGKPDVSYFEAVADDELREDMSLEELLERLAPYSVGKVRIGDPRDQLFRVTLVAMRGGSRALVVSMSHILGDGATFYGVYKQLSPANEVCALVAKRETGFAARSDGFSSMVDEAGKEYLLSPRPFLGTVARAVLKGLASVLGLARLLPRPEGRMFHVDASFLEAEKTRLRDGERWVSSNDIITSWYINEVAEAGCAKMMAVNLRGRDASLAHDLAGNYLGVTTYAPGDDVSARGIRASLVPASARAPRAGRFPGLWRSLVSPWTIVTNWAAFYTHIELKGFVAKRHIPLLPTADTFGLASVCIIFNPGQPERPDGLAVFASKGFFCGPLPSGKHSIVGEEVTTMLKSSRPERRRCCAGHARAAGTALEAAQQATKAA
jgi:hypothetical protein